MKFESLVLADCDKGFLGSTFAVFFSGIFSSLSSSSLSRFLFLSKLVFSCVWSLAFWIQTWSIENEYCSKSDPWKINTTKNLVKKFWLLSCYLELTQTYLERNHTKNNTYLMARLLKCKRIVRNGTLKIVFKIKHATVLMIHRNTTKKKTFFQDLISGILTLIM